MEKILKTSGSQNTAVEKVEELAEVAKVAEFFLNQLEVGLLFNEVK
jgi:hypothetical protein